MDILDQPEQKVIDIKRRQQIAFRRFVRFEGIDGGKYVGIGAHDLRKWLEERFVTGMSWDNYCDVWIIDHLVPLALFDLSNENDLRICWHYKNLVPIFRDDNLRKGVDVSLATFIFSKIESPDYHERKLIERILPEINRLELYSNSYFKLKK